MRATSVSEQRRIEFNPRILVAAALAILALAAMAAITLSIVKSARRAQPAPSSSPRSKSGEIRSGSSQVAPGSSRPSDKAQTPARAQDGVAALPAPGPEGSGAADGALSGSAPSSADVSQVPLPDAAGRATGGSRDEAQAQPSETSRTQAVPPSPGLPAANAAAAGGGKLSLRVIPFHAIRFDLLCNGTSIHSGFLAVGVPVSFECSGVFEVSLEDAGAVSMTVNGDRIYLGRPGQPLAGRHISAANYRDFTNAPSEAIPR